MQDKIDRRRGTAQHNGEYSGRDPQKWVARVMARKWHQRHAQCPTAGHRALGVRVGEKEAVCRPSTVGRGGWTSAGERVWASGGVSFALCLPFHDCRRCGGRGQHSLVLSLGSAQGMHFSSFSSFLVKSTFFTFQHISTFIDSEQQL